jgi:hypothetical protein
MRRFELLEKDRVGLSFPYNEQAIARIKQIPGRKWNAQEKRWEIPLSHLQEAIQALGADPTNLPRPLLEAYQAQWGQDIDARLEAGNCFTELSGKKIPIDEIDEVTSFWMEGAEHTDRYKKGQWDGRKRLLKQRKTIEFPTGLLSRVQEVLDRRRIRYEIIQTAPAPTPSLKLSLHDIELRNYQKESVKAAITEGRGCCKWRPGRERPWSRRRSSPSWASPRSFSFTPRICSIRPRDISSGSCKSPSGRSAMGSSRFNRSPWRRFKPPPARSA